VKASFLPDFLITLSICDGAQQHLLQCCEPDEVVKVIGVYQAPSGSMAAQIKSLTEKPNSWVAALLKGYMECKLV